MAKKNESTKKVQGAEIASTNVDNKVQESNLISKVWDGVQYKEVKGLSHEELIQRENSLKETYKLQASEVSAKVALYRKSLEGTLDTIKTLYNGTINVFDGTNSIEVKTNIDALVRLSHVPIEKFFDIKFVGGLYDTYTFTLLEGVQTLKAEKRKVSEKTDFKALSERCEKVLGFYVDIEASKFTEKDNTYYWMPILNFSVSKVFKQVFAVNKESLFKISLQVLKAEKKAAKRKAKKAEKKVEKAEVSVNTETAANS